VEPVPKSSKLSCSVNTCLVQAPRRDPPPPIPVQISSPPFPAVPAPFPRFLPAPQSFQFVQQGAASLTSAPPSECSAPSVSSSRRAPSILTVASTAPPPIQTLPRSVEAFLQARTTPSPAPADAAALRSEVLLQAIAALKASLQATTAGQEAVKAQATESGGRQRKAPRCKFCGNAGHLIKDCEEVEGYILIGKCKCNKSGRIVLPSGAEAPPPRTNSRTLRERFEDHHQLQAAVSGPYRAEVAIQQSPGPPQARQAAPVGARATLNPLAPEAKHPVVNSEAL
jgi:hypothetical protein